jgi:hypothetical protein
MDDKSPLASTQLCGGENGEELSKGPRAQFEQRPRTRWMISSIHSTVPLLPLSHRPRQHKQLSKLQAEASSGMMCLEAAEMSSGTMCSETG